MADVVIYTRDFCGFCARAKSLLDSKGVKYTEHNATETPSARAEMIQRSGRSTFPQVFVGSTHVGGCDDLFAMERAGKLDLLLAG
ncbi:Glutaredoxin-3 [Hartmannibacter diazotrophicus]|uniref:Glutaredoxin n=1 Tax=Hartmannibacter diazotrophicus TaxID=1482074 RepID=A0A2C9DAQ6_9HYPH|nr:glutaredoxin 3 [Hartmannibacter diazotrophicus]SON57346.1 Glutaredoxin-3 [Hartmannibacter diazotrophicus]